MHGADVAVLRRLAFGVEACGDLPHGMEQFGPGSRGVHLGERCDFDVGRACRRQLTASDHDQREKGQLHRRGSHLLPSLGAAAIGFHEVRGRSLQPGRDYFFDPPPLPLLPDATLTRMAAELLAWFGSLTSPVTDAVFVIVVLPLTSTVTVI